MPVKGILGLADERVGMSCAIAGCVLAICLMSAISFAAQQTGTAGKKVRKRSLSWNPPNVDAPVRSASPSPPCALANVLEEAGARATQLATDLQNFTAQEEIAYESFDREGLVEDFGSAAFDYVVIFQHAPGQPTIEEIRKLTHGRSLGAIAEQDRGVPEIVLLFLPNRQDDYEMQCEGAGDRQGQHTWVVRFHQRTDRPRRTVSFLVGNEVYSVGLKGHAWIAGDSGEVVHLETALIEGVPALKVVQWHLAIDYVPVHFRTPDVQVWLPQTADSYYEFNDHRTMIYHTFTNFMLFSVQTDETIGKPKQP